MKSTIGIYESNHDALEAIHKLQSLGFPRKQISLLGRADMKDEHVHVKHANPMNVAATEVGIGAVVGPVLGALIGIGIFAVPGLGFLYGAGALVGALAGFDFGLIGGGIASAFTLMGMKEPDAQKYEAELQAGKFIVVAQGNEEEITKAAGILHEHGTHLDIRTH